LGWVARFGLGVWQTWHENGGNQTQFVPKPVARVGKRGPRSRNPNPNISVVDILLILAKKGSITTSLCLGREGGVWVPIQLAKKLLEKSLEKPLEKPLEISYTGETPKMGSLDMSQNQI